MSEETPAANVCNEAHYQCKICGGNPTAFPYEPDRSINCTNPRGNKKPADTTPSQNDLGLSFPPSKSHPWEVWGVYQAVPEYDMPERVLRISCHTTKEQAQDFIRRSGEEAQVLGIKPCAVELRNSHRPKTKCFKMGEPATGGGECATVEEALEKANAALAGFGHGVFYCTAPVSVDKPKETLYKEYVAALDKRHYFPQNASTDNRIEILALVVERRLAALEANSHAPVTFVEDEEGYLKVGDKADDK